MPLAPAPGRPLGLPAVSACDPMTPPTGFTRPAEPEPGTREPPGICPIIPLPGLAPITPPEGMAVMRPVPMPGFRPPPGSFEPGPNPPPRPGVRPGGVITPGSGLEMGGGDGNPPMGGGVIVGGGEG